MQLATKMSTKMMLHAVDLFSFHYPISKAAKKKKKKLKVEPPKEAAPQAFTGYQLDPKSIGYVYSLVLADTLAACDLPKTIVPTSISFHNAGYP